MSDWQSSPPSGPPPGQGGYQQPYGGQQHDGQYGGQPYGGQQYGAPPPGGGYYGGHAPVRPPRASFWERAAASIIDGLIASVVMMLFVVPLAIVAVAGSTLEDQACTPTSTNPNGICSVPTGATVGLWLLLGLVWFVAYLALIFFLLIRPVSKTGQTIGRRTMNIRVVDADTGQLISTGRAFGRYLFAAFISGFMYIGYLWMLWDDNRQTLHDKVANSVVVPA